MTKEVTIRIVVQEKDCEERPSFDERELERLSTVYSGWYLRERMREEK